MSGPEEHFLMRWSRLKRQGGEPEDPDERRPAGDDVDAPASPDVSSTAKIADAAVPAEPEFDIASLPPIDSITATTDIRPFLARGVPAALTRAALRRMWTADPSIRDFIEIAENQWDFANPDSIPGFSTFQPSDDIGRYVAELGSKAEELLEKIAESTPGEAAEPSPTPLSARTAEAEDERAHQSALPAPSERIVQRSEGDVAVPKEPVAGTRHAARPTRRGGGALPR